MKILPTFSKQKRQGASAFFLLVFLAIQALAIFPALHERIHPDAGAADHECAITLITHGQVETPVVASPVFVAPSTFIYTQFTAELVFVSVDLRLLPSRGPPTAAVPA